MASPTPVAGYFIETGSSLDKARLVKFMQRAYRELSSIDASAHLAETVERHLSSQSQLWWLIKPSPITNALPGIHRPDPLGCLWLGEAVDQRTGLKQAYVFLLYVEPAHRRKGLGTALMAHAQQWAKQQGYGQIGLQVFEDNQSALALYQKLGYVSQARWLSLDL